MGAPSPEAMARLQAAVSKAPAQAPVARPAAPAAKPARFGIGSLISRMSGGGAAAEAAQPQRAQPPVTSYDDEAEPASDADRLEIPAFLRRQAN
jgi:cell division protein FtsZ